MVRARTTAPQLGQVALRALSSVTGSQKLWLQVGGDGPRPLVRGLMQQPGALEDLRLRPHLRRDQRLDGRGGHDPCPAPPIGLGSVSAAVRAACLPWAHVQSAPAQRRVVLEFAGPAGQGPHLVHPAPHSGGSLSTTQARADPRQPLAYGEGAERPVGAPRGL